MAVLDAQRQDAAATWLAEAALRDDSHRAFDAGGRWPPTLLIAGLGSVCSSAGPLAASATDLQRRSSTLERPAP